MYKRQTDHPEDASPLAVDSEQETTLSGFTGAPADAQMPDSQTVPDQPGPENVSTTVAHAFTDEKIPDIPLPPVTGQIFQDRGEIKEDVAPAHRCGEKTDENSEGRTDLSGKTGQE